MQQSGSRLFAVLLTALDQLSHSLAALLPDLLVEGGTVPLGGRLTPAPPDLRVMIGAVFRLGGAAAFLADLPIQFRAVFLLFFLTIRPPPSSTLFPYTTLFR